LERRLATLLAGGDMPALSVLRQQLTSAVVTEREYSGVGFFTHFQVAPDAPRLPVARWVIGDVGFTLQGHEHPAGALLFVDGGVVSMLEGFSYADEDWPAEPEVSLATYTTRGNRTVSGHTIEPVGTRDLAWLREEFEAAVERSAAG